MTDPTVEHTVDVLIPHIMSPGARLGEYHRTDCRCTSTSEFGRDRGPGEFDECSGRPSSNR